MAKRAANPKKKSAPRKRLPKPGIDIASPPSWWITKPDDILRFLESLKGVEIEEIGRTAGDRPIVAARWGDVEMLPGRTCTSLASAVAGGDPLRFYGQGERKQQVVLFVGAAHGCEIEGTVGALNYLNILVTGKDLRGRRQTAMADAGRKHCFIVIPILNVDGRVRQLEYCHKVNANTDWMSMVCQGLSPEGEILRWPSSKLVYPMPQDCRIMGTYYNDNGVNLVYDCQAGPDCQPENAALLRYCRRILPDCAIFSHTDNGSLVQPPTSFVPVHYRQRVLMFAAAAGLRCAKAGYVKNRVPTRITSYAGDMFYQTDAVYHAAGSLPLLVEFPCGYQNLPDNHDDILDICLAVIDEICVFGSHYRFRPPDPNWK